jgi:hypothetical protein
MRMLLPRRASNGAQIRCMSLTEANVPFSIPSFFADLKLQKYQGRWAVGCPYIVAHRWKGKQAL